MNIDSNTTIYLNNTEIVQVIDGGGQVIWQKGSTPPTPINYFYIKNQYSSSRTFTLEKNGSVSSTPEYSKDKVNWTSINSTTSITLSKNETVYFRSSNGWSSSGSDYWRFSNLNYMTAGGDIRTLLNYNTLPSTATNYCFYRLFYNSNLYYSANIDLSGITTLASSCYMMMFRGNIYLNNAPTLHAKTLVSSCYHNMFYGCKKINSITTYADDISATDCILSWLYDVAASGTFYNNGSATYNINSASGIPTGWTEVTPTPYFTLSNVVLTANTTVDNYQVTATLDTNMNWSKMTIDISNCDVGPCNRNTYLDITPSEVSNNQLVSSNDISIWFGNPDDWMTITVYDSNNTQIYSETNIPYITVNPSEPS